MHVVTSNCLQQGANEHQTLPKKLGGAWYTIYKQKIRNATLW